MSRPVCHYCNAVMEPACGAAPKDAIISQSILFVNCPKCLPIMQAVIDALDPKTPTL